MWDLIVLIPDNCLSRYFSLLRLETQKEVSGSTCTDSEAGYTDLDIRVDAS